MEPTVLTRLVERQVSESVAAALGRAIDRVAETYTEDLLRDPAFKAEMLALLRAAFAQTIRQLNEPMREARS